MDKQIVPIHEKYTLTISEAAEYFNIGEKRLRTLINDHPDKFTISCGTKRLIIRHKFEKFIDEALSV